MLIECYLHFLPCYVPYPSSALFSLLSFSAYFPLTLSNPFLLPSLPAFLLFLTGACGSGAVYGECCQPFHTGADIIHYTFHWNRLKLWWRRGIIIHFLLCGYIVRGFDRIGERGKSWWQKWEERLLRQNLLDVNKDKEEKGWGIGKWGRAVIQIKKRIEIREI